MKEKDYGGKWNLPLWSSLRNGHCIQETRRHKYKEKLGLEMKNIIPEIKNPVDGLESSDKSLQSRERKKRKMIKLGYT